MRVFITGATGYIGSVISKKLLAQGHQVMGLARSQAAKASLQAQGITVHPGDLRLAASLAAGAVETDAVFHVAASREPDAVQ
jgi:nucleoside-diphosphate-sugar epimerase